MFPLFKIYTLNDFFRIFLEDVHNAGMEVTDAEIDQTFIESGYVSGVGTQTLGNHFSEKNGITMSK